MNGVESIQMANTIGNASKPYICDLLTASGEVRHRHLVSHIRRKVQIDSMQGREMADAIGKASETSIRDLIAARRNK